jgi:hypothetical protein
MPINAFYTFNVVRERMFGTAFRYEILGAATANVYVRNEELCTLYGITEEAEAFMQRNPRLSFERLENFMAGDDYDKWDNVFSTVTRSFWKRCKPQIESMRELAVVTAYAAFHEYDNMETALEESFAFYCVECCCVVPLG